MAVEGGEAILATANELMLDLAATTQMNQGGSCEQSI